VRLSDSGLPVAHVPKNPAIPLRDGVAPSCVALPRMRVPPWPTLLDFLAQRFPCVGHSEWARRMTQAEVLGEDGQPLPPDTPYLNGARVYYWRALASEAVIPFEAEVIYRDAHLVVADKPHFLPVTPGGRYVQQSLLVRLKRTLGLADLSPLHRIDRETAGLVVFSVRPPDRDAYQRLFRERRIHKTYQAIAPAAPHFDGPVTRRSHIRECEGAFYKMREAAPDEGLPPNSETLIERLEQNGPWARYRLQPISGRRHQLRVHMNGLGLPIAGDQFYPQVRRLPGEAEDYADPLRLLAQALRFTDPVTGQERHFQTRRTLDWPGEPPCSGLA